MSIEVTVPALGESIVEATVGRWMKHPGDAVAAGDALVELETDKVNMEVVAPDNGTLQSIARQEGDTVNIGDVLGTIDGAVRSGPRGVPSGSGPEPEVVAASSSAPADSSDTDSPGADSSGAIQSRRAGPQSNRGWSPQTPGPAENPPHPTPSPPPTQGPEPDPEGTPQGPQSDDGARSTPLARRIAAEHGVDIGQIPGSGPSGRVTRDDVETFIERRQTPADAGISSAAPSVPAPPPAPQPAAPSQTQRVPPTAPAPEPAAPVRPEERVRMSRRRQTIARRLVEAQQTAAMLTTFNEVDMTAIMDIRKRRREQFKERFGIGLGFMSFFTKAVVAALKEFPRVNAEIQGDEMILKHYYDIGIAVGAEEGLVVPVVRNADRLTFAEIEREIADLALKARDGRLSLAELQGGTFTISNGGIYGSLLSTPILNTPQVGILGMHKIQDRPVALNGQVTIRPMMYVALSYDHRIVDGNEAVRFLVRIKELLEDPSLLLVES